MKLPGGPGEHWEPLLDALRSESVAGRADPHRLRTGAIAISLVVTLVAVGGVVVLGPWSARLHLLASRSQQPTPTIGATPTPSPEPTPTVAPVTPPPTPPPTVQPAPPAVAPPPTAPPKLSPTPIVTSLAVPAAGGWVSTGITVASGQAITITATGAWTPGPPETGLVGPDGSAQEWPDNFFDLQELGVCNYCAQVRTTHWAALVGYVGASPPQPGSYQSTAIRPDAQQVFLVGSNYHGVAARAGVLWLAINDDAYSGYGTDNSGQVSTTVSASPR